MTSPKSSGSRCAVLEDFCNSSRCPRRNTAESNNNGHNTPRLAVSGQPAFFSSCFATVDTSDCTGVQTLLQSHRGVASTHKAPQHKLSGEFISGFANTRLRGLEEIKSKLRTVVRRDPNNEKWAVKSPVGFMHSASPSGTLPMLPAFDTNSATANGDTGCAWAEEERAEERADEIDKIQMQDHNALPLAHDPSTLSTAFLSRKNARIRQLSLLQRIA